MRFAPLNAVAGLIALLVYATADAALWQPIGRGSNKVDIDRSRIGRTGDGLVLLWSRAVLPQPAGDGDARYNSIEALNRYDCNGNRFTTLKRLYLLDNTMVRVEPVLVPREMPASAGSIDATIIGDVCKAGPQNAATGTSAMWRADPQKASDGTVPGYINVADSATAAPPPRFITLPRIDPSLVQHPTDEVKPAEVAKHAEAAGKIEAGKAVAATSSRKETTKEAVRTEAAKAGVSLGQAQSKTSATRRAREIELATSGTRKAKEDAIAATASHAENVQIPWSYDGDGAAAKWARLRPDYSLCDSGQRQSPIDIRDAIHVDLEPIKFDYRSSMFRIIDNGHSVQINVGEGNSLSVMGRTYQLVHLDFHRPAEERIDGRSFDMALHLVHRDDEGRLAVVAVLIEPGAEQSVIQTFWNNLPLETNLELAPPTAVDLNKLLPETRTYYTYMGSLTTPPCTEGVLWMVLKKPLQLSPEQMAIFARLYRNNARPIQSANGRLIKDSR